MENLKEIIDEIKSYKIKPSDDMILRCATDIFLSNLPEEVKEDY